MTRCQSSHVLSYVKTRGLGWRLSADHVTDHKHHEALYTLQHASSQPALQDAVTRGGQRPVYTESITQKTRWLKILTDTDKSSIRGQISTKVPYAESLEACLHIHMLFFFYTVIALEHCENTQNVGARYNLSLSTGQDHERERERERERTLNVLLIRPWAHFNGGLNMSESTKVNYTCIYVQNMHAY